MTKLEKIEKARRDLYLPEPAALRIQGRLVQLAVCRQSGTVALIIDGEPLDLNPVEAKQLSMVLEMCTAAGASIVGLNQAKVGAMLTGEDEDDDLGVQFRTDIN